MSEEYAHPNAGKLSGQRINDRYLLVGLIGRGGWSEIYEGFDQQLNRKVAIKILYAHLTWQTDSVRRFQAEAEAAANINHANVIAIYDYGFLPDGQPFIVMQLSTGTTLKERLKDSGPIEWQEAVRIFLALCSGLKAAHEAGVVHRDVKPSNILIASDGEKSVKLADFGLAKQHHAEAGHSLTQTGETIGTPYYMSPEQCMGERVDRRTDIYGLGCVMYETLSGQLPFEGASVFEILLNQVNVGPRALAPRVGQAIPADLERIIFRCLRKAPDERYANVEELAQDLQKVLAGQSIGKDKIKFGKAPSGNFSSKMMQLPLMIVALAASAVILVPSIALASSSSDFSMGLNLPALVSLQAKDDLATPVRPPGLRLSVGQSLFVPFFNPDRSLFRACHTERDPSGFTTYRYNGLLVGSSGIVSYTASETIDPEKALAECSVTYTGDMSAKFVSSGATKTTKIKHIRVIDTVHRENGFLETDLRCFDGKIYACSTKENGEIARFKDEDGS